MDQTVLCSPYRESDFRFTPGTVPDAQNFNDLFLFTNPINDSVIRYDDLPDMGLAPFGNHAAEFGKLLEVVNSVKYAVTEFQSGIGIIFGDECGDIAQVLS